VHKAIMTHIVTYSWSVHNKC